MKKRMKKSALSYAITLAVFSLPVLADTTQSSDVDVMVVTATTNQTSLREAPATISVITSEDLNRTPVNDVASALESVPGVHVVRSSGSEPNIIIRGLKNNNTARDNFTLLLVNGRRINSGETMVRGAGFDFSSIPISAIDRIEVIRGPMSSLYGSDALGGVVNVILKQPTEETRINASLSYSHPEEGDGAMTKGNVWVSGSALPDKLLYSVAAEVSQQDAWFPDDVHAGNNFSGNAEQERKGIQAALTWLVNENNKILWDISYLEDKRTYPDTDRNSSADDDITNGKKYTTSLGHQGEWSWGNNNINYLYENSKIHDDNTHPLLAVANAKQQNHSLDAKFGITAIDGQLITTGFDVLYSSIDIDRDYNDSQSLTQNALFLQDQITLSDTLSATLSGRLTHNNNFGSDFTPRAYLVYTPSDRLTLKGGYAEGFKTPSIYQSSKEFTLVSCGGACYLTGNPDLKPESSKTVEFTSSYRGDSWFVQGTVFANQIENMIDRDTSTRATGFITYQNIKDDVESKGLELEGDLDISDTLYLNANATYTKTEVKATGLDLENVPSWLANITLNWDVSTDLTLFTSANYTGKQWGYSYSLGENIWFDPYVIANLGASYRINHDWTVKAGVTNFLDKNLQAESQDYQESEIGRSYYITIDMAL